jgi:uncharacterized protein YfaT (DUF1175 family)
VPRPQLRIAIVAAVCAGIVYALAAVKRGPAVIHHVEISPNTLWADGYDSATLTVAAPAATRPRVSVIGNPHIAFAGPFERHGAVWISEIHAGVLPGTVQLRVEFPGAPTERIALTTTLAERDSRDDGTPDFLRLDSDSARAAFRRWFTYLAEAQYFQQPGARPVEIDDCAALIRYAYRETLRAHDAAWASTARLPLVPAFDSPGKYEYPFTALGASLFRVEPGPFRAADLSGGAFAQFADAKTLWRFNTHLVSRNLDRANAGDLLFYRQQHGEGPETFHSMIFLGESQIHPDRARYVLYHTGPQDSGPGEMRRLILDELRRFPEAEWRPDPENPRFLGVYRWNILRSNEAIP